MATYGKFCPIAKAAGVLSERWTLLILREVMSGSSRFNDLERGLPGISRALLSKRLRKLVDSGILMPKDDSDGIPGYVLTTRGQQLQPIVISIGEWGQRWLNSGIAEEDVDTDLLIWDIHKRIDINRLPVTRFIVEIQFRGVSAKSYWLVFEHGQCSVCFDPPGFDIDLLFEADTISLHDVWLGRADLILKMKQDLIRVYGPQNQCNAFVQSLQYNLFAPIPYEGTEPIHHR